MPPFMTPAFIHSLIQTPALPKNNWYHIAAVTLSIINRPEEIPAVWKYAIKHDSTCIPNSDEESYVQEERQWLSRNQAKERVGRIEVRKVKDDAGREIEGQRESALRIARRMREALVKSAAVGGLPKAINSLLSLKNACPQHLLDPIPDDSLAPDSDTSTPSSTSLPPSLHSLTSPHPTTRAHSLSPKQTVGPILTRGHDFWSRVYGPVGPRIMTSMSSSAPDLGIMAKWMYGLLLSEETVLSGRETGFLMVAALVPQDTNPQLKGHLKGCVNNGATKEEVNAVREMVMRICEQVDMQWRVPPSKL